MLEEDAARFDAFLKENDLKVQEAIRQGELEAKRKNDKVQEIKGSAPTSPLPAASWESERSG